MVFNKITGLTGSGVANFGAVDLQGLFRVHVTNFGKAKPAGPDGDPQLRLNIGWISPAEDVPLGDGMDVAGNFIFTPAWINLEMQDFDFKREANDFNGFTGVAHVLQDGVVIDFWWFS